MISLYNKDEFQEYKHYNSIFNSYFLINMT